MSHFFKSLLITGCFLTLVPFEANAQAACFSNDDCPSGYECVADNCQPFGTNSGGGTLGPGEPCTSNMECANAQCDFDAEGNGICAPEMETILIPGFILAAAGLARRSRKRAQARRASASHTAQP